MRPDQVQCELLAYRAKVVLAQPIRLFWPPVDKDTFEFIPRLSPTKPVIRWINETLPCVIELPVGRSTASHLASLQAKLRTTQKSKTTIYKV